MIVIVTDSSATLTREDAEQLGAVLVPMSYSVAGRSLSLESYSGENGEFEPLIARDPAQNRTSQATLSAFLSTFEQIVSEGNQVLCLTISSRLSGTYGNALMAAREVGKGCVEVVDSRIAGGGIYLLAREARRMIDAGMGLTETALALRRLREKVGNVFSVDDMAPLRRSGRLGLVRMGVSTMLNIRPMLTCSDGAVVSFGVVRGRVEQRRALLKRLPERAKLIVIQHLGADARAAELAEELRGRGEVIVCSFGPVLGIHLGEGAIGIAWIEEK